MMRKMVVVGDPPAPGGAVLPYSSREYTLHGHQVALIGGRAYCEGCNSVGIIAKAGGPRRMEFISEVALEGDVVICHCPVPPPLIATLVHTSWVDDMGGGAGDLEPHMLVPGWLSADRSTMAASKRLVDSEVTYPPEAEQTENICPNMTNREFCDRILKTRDDAVALISQRLSELDRWDSHAQVRVKKWFGHSGEDVRAYLRKGIGACERVLRGLKAENFVRYSAGHSKHLGCTFPSNADGGTVAAVCKPDLATRTIAIAPKFCGLEQNIVKFGTQTVLPGDTQLLTLVHEVTHFDDTFSSHDTWYTSRQSLAQAKFIENRVALLSNADSIASYIVGVEE
ncbi:PAAR domain-containing protein [Variovorax sp. M-6]|uniref:PAAR domain-containing protein n=1 Tax=Variovorax sp. M-6 TaxID=3233041 RepID=UPI003F964C58